MPSMEELANSVENYRNGSLSLDDFEDWFRDSSRGMFGESDGVREACLLIESAFSHVRFEDASEEVFRGELAEAIHPFWYEVRVHAPPIEMVSRKPSRPLQKTAAFRPLVLHPLLTVSA
jgi:hypothetical protein